MPFIMTDQVGYLRTRIGSPLTFEISDAAIVMALTEALREYSRYRPLKKNRPLDLVADVDRYVLDADVTAVLDCVVAFKEDAPPRFIGSPNLYGEPYRPSRSLDLIEAMEAEAAERFDGHSWEFDGSTGELVIFPPPPHTVTTSVTTAHTHTEATMPDRDLPLMLKFAQAEAMTTLGLFRSKVKELPTGVGYKMTLDAGETLLKEAERKRKEFYDEIADGGSWIVTG